MRNLKKKFWSMDKKIGGISDESDDMKQQILLVDPDEVVVDIVFDNVVVDGIFLNCS